MLGIAFGIFFPPALASVARMYPRARGKAIAIWGQAYSFGLAAAALSGFAGGAWRWVFIGCAVPAVLAVGYVPRWVEPERDPSPPPLAAQLLQYARRQSYRLAACASFGGLSMHFVVIGFSPVYFVDRGVDLRLVAALLAAGRALSGAVKLVGGALYDRRGGPWTARLILLATSALGVSPAAGAGRSWGFGCWCPSSAWRCRRCRWPTPCWSPRCRRSRAGASAPSAPGFWGWRHCCRPWSACFWAGGCRCPVLMTAALCLPVLVAVALHRAVGHRQRDPLIDLVDDPEGVAALLVAERGSHAVPAGFGKVDDAADHQRRAAVRTGPPCRAAGPPRCWRWPP